MFKFLFGGGEAEKPAHEIRFIFSGLDHQGKTALLYKLKTGTVPQTVPSVGFEVERLEALKGPRGTPTVWALGGGCKLRELYHHYVPGTSVVFWLIACDEPPHRIQDSLRELKHFLATSATTLNKQQDESSEPSLLQQIVFLITKVDKITGGHAAIRTHCDWLVSQFQPVAEEALKSEAWQKLKPFGAPKINFAKCSLMTPDGLNEVNALIWNITHTSKKPLGGKNLWGQEVVEDEKSKKNENDDDE